MGATHTVSMTVSIIVSLLFVYNVAKGDDVHEQPIVISMLAEWSRHDDPFPSAYTLWVSVLMLRMGSDDNHGMFIGQCCSHDTVECIAVTLHTAESSRTSNTRQAQHDWWDQDDRLAM